ncbi:MAG: SRPBCC domain-containing protein [Paracoccaceae bacterium]|jgi:hypothetical protein
MIEPIIKTITVTCAPDKAFGIFTKDIGKWWPLATHSISSGNGAVATNVTIEGIVGGSIYETAPDGTRLDWGKVTTFDQGKTFAMTWHLNNPPSLGTLITVTFKPHADGTAVILQHDNWDALGEGATEKRNQYNSGWIEVFETSYAAACQK